MATAELGALGRGSHYSGVEIERELVEIAIARGNIGHAARTLKRDGLPVPYSTLHRWRFDTFPDCYVEIHREILPACTASSTASAASWPRQPPDAALQPQRRQGFVRRPSL